jgi:hypothetical protein
LEKVELSTHLSGTVLFVAKLISIATGIFFKIMVLNSLSKTIMELARAGTITYVSAKSI